MLIRPNTDVLPSEITDEVLFNDRRTWLKAAGLLSVAAFLSDAVAAAPVKSPFSTAEKPNSFQEITTYNNFYEFGTDKSEPAENAHTLKTRPWSLLIDGEVEKPLRLSIDDVLKIAAHEERIYRLRCVEGWSMVVPWMGYSLSALLKKVQPTSRARYVELTTLLDPKQMPGQERRVLEWPYVEGLRIDEAMHPLTLLGTGLYGKALLNQNGAPIRLIVPWKYGFKSAKSLVRIRFTEKQPINSWNLAAPREYGFYANVNPTVDHPRWSQAKERRIGEFRKRETLMFNGYGDQVARLYAGMDLSKYY